MAKNIEIDFDVFKALTNLRPSENVSYNDVIRTLLNLPNKKTTENTKPKGDPWITKGILIPHGTEFRAFHKGEKYSAEVNNGALVFNEKRFHSPSAAAIEITKNSINGWKFWECKFPGEMEWKGIDGLRLRAM